MCVCLSYIVLYSAVVHGWVEAQSQVINTEKRRQRETEIVFRIKADFLFLLKPKEKGD